MRPLLAISCLSLLPMPNGRNHSDSQIKRLPRRISDTLPHNSEIRHYPPCDILFRIVRRAVYEKSIPIPRIRPILIRTVLAPIHRHMRRKGRFLCPTANHAVRFQSLHPFQEIVRRSINPAVGFCREKVSSP